MKEEEILKEIEGCMISFDVEKLKNECKRAMKFGISPLKIIVDGMAKGMDVVGKKFENGEYFLSELIMAGETMKEGVRFLEPYLKDEKRESMGKVVVGTVQGDLHDIGKNLVVMMLSSSGFDVIDLGTDVTSDKFVEVVSKEKPDIVGMSCLLTTCIPEMKKAIEEIDKNKLRKDLRIIIGGAAVSENVAKEVGADYAAKDVIDGVNMCKRWIKM